MTVLKKSFAVQRKRAGHILYSAAYALQIERRDPFSTRRSNRRCIVRDRGSPGRDPTLRPKRGVGSYAEYIWRGPSLTGQQILYIYIYQQI